MKVNIDNKDIELKYSFRAYMLYENMTGEPFQPTGKISDFITFFYAIVMASDKTVGVDFDTFIDWLDENTEALTEFVNWLTTNIQKTEKLSKKTEETTVEDKPKN